MGFFSKNRFKLSSLTVYGGNGDGDLFGWHLLKNKLYGHDGGDNFAVFGIKNYLYRGEENDKIFSFGARNRLYGNAGNDYLFAVGVRNYLSGGLGDDVLFANGVTNTLDGEAGDDTLTAFGVVNRLYGGSGDDYMFADGVYNSLFGGSGDDIIFSSGVYNNISGGAGNDIITALGIINNIDGGYGDDTIIGSSYNDNLSGGEGNDILIAGGGNNTLTGNSGADTFILTKNQNATDIITDYQQGEIINLKNVGDIIHLDQANIYQERSHTIIKLFDNQKIILKNFNKDDLRNEDFVFDDFDSIEKGDLTVANNGSDGDDVIYGDGSYSAYQHVSGDGPGVWDENAPMIADVNGDGMDDIIFTFYSSSLGTTIRSKISNGDGTYSAYQHASGDGPGVWDENAPMIADINGDGMDDIIFTFYSSSLGTTIRSKISNGDGTYRAYQHVSGDGSGIWGDTDPMIADINGDGMDDIIFTFYDSTLGTTIRSKISNGDGSYSAYQHVSRDGPGVWDETAPMIADVNGDGMDDIIFTFYDSTLGTTIRSKLSNGDGSYSAYEHVSGDGPGVWDETAPMIADVNGDGMDDIIFTFYDSTLGTTIRSKLSNGDGSYSAYEHVSGDGPGVWDKIATMIADVNGDGMDDIIFTFYDSTLGTTIRSKLSNGDGSYSAYQHASKDGPGVWDETAPMIADVNGDGMDDIIFTFYDSNLGTTIRSKISNGTEGQELYAGSGNDEVYGQKGDDRLFGESGDDNMFGGVGNDYLNGGTGNDDLKGEDGYDLLLGGDGNDELSGGEGNDKLYGGNDNDSLTGGSGHDLVQGDGGNDNLQGNSGNDAIYGGDGNDTLDGGENNDNISGGLGVDFLIGGSGDDFFDFSSLEDSSINATDIIADFEQGSDKINLSEIEEDLSFASFEFVVENGYTVIQDQNSDFAINLNGQFDMNEGDFIF